MLYEQYKSAVWNMRGYTFKKFKSFSKYAFIFYRVNAVQRLTDILDIMYMLHNIDEIYNMTQVCEVMNYAARVLLENIPVLRINCIWSPFQVTSN